MRRKLGAAALAMFLMAGLAGGGHAAEAKKPAKPVEVKVCPISMEAVAGNGVGSAVVDNYKVYFCCDGCPQAFSKLSKAKKLEKIRAALKQQEDAKKKQS